MSDMTRQEKDHYLKKLTKQITIRQEKCVKDDWNVETEGVLHFGAYVALTKVPE